MRIRFFVFCLMFLVAVIGVGLYYLQTRPSKAPEVPIGETSQGGDYGGESHETSDPPVGFVGKSYIPEGAAVTPDFPPVDPNEDPVAAAHKRLAYIKNNPYAWGGVHSERATQLIEQLMPPMPPMDHAHGDEVIEQILELIEQNDPRAAEVLITHMCEGGTVGEPMFEGLDAIGPPAVPYILPYLEKGVAEGGRIRIAVFESLGRLGARYRSDLGGIVDHIIIPKLEVIAADEDNEFYRYADVNRASEALSVLR